MRTRPGPQSRLLHRPHLAWISSKLLDARGGLQNVRASTNAEAAPEWLIAHKIKFFDAHGCALPNGASPEVRGDCVLNGDPGSPYSVRFGEEGAALARVHCAHAGRPWAPTPITAKSPPSSRCASRTTSSGDPAKTQDLGQHPHHAGAGAWDHGEGDGNRGGGGGLCRHPQCQHCGECRPNASLRPTSDSRWA